MTRKPTKHSISGRRQNEKKLYRMYGLFSENNTDQDKVI